MDAARTFEFVSTAIDSSALPALMDFVRIPSVSPAFDPDWVARGQMEKAMDVLLDWVDRQQVKGLKRDFITHPNSPPVVFIEIEASSPGLPSVLVYGHMDKQPPFTGWSSFCGPYEPTLKDGLLYGRGCVDDGFAVMSTVIAVKAIQEQGKSHGRCCIIIENEEESGSSNLLSNLEIVKQKVGSANFIICLDSGVLDYERLWMTFSLRGFLEFYLKVKILTSGVHSGDASGVVPSSFRIIRRLLDRIEDARTGRLLIPQFYPPVSSEYRERVSKLIEFAGESLYKRFPFIEGAQPVTLDEDELMINNLQRPSLCVMGASGLPDCEVAGNVLRPETVLSLSFRTPPEVDEEAALQEVIRILTVDPPYSCEVSILNPSCGKGWLMPPSSSWFSSVCLSASQSLFHKDPMHLASGASVPLMRSLQDLYPNADCFVTGISGPATNAHGPDENLDIQYWKKFTTCMALILHGHSSS